MSDFIVPGTNGMQRFWRLNASGADEIGGNTLSVSNTTYKKTSRGYQTYCATANGSSSSLTSGATVSGVRTVFFSIYPTSNNRTFLTATGITITINSSSQIATSGLTGVSVIINGQATSTVTLNAWNFVTLTHNSANYASVNIFASSFIGDAQEIGTFDRIISETEIHNWYLESLRSLGGNTLAGLMDGVVAYYDFRGDANDIVGGYDGTVNGATLTTDRFGNANSAYSFDGTNDYISIPDSDGLDLGSNDFTVSVFAKFNNTSSPQNLFSKMNEYYNGGTIATGFNFGITPNFSDTQFGFSTWEGNANTYIGGSLNNFYGYVAGNYALFTARRTGSTLDFLLNGTVIFSGSGTIRNVNTSFPANIGRYNWSYEQYLNGNVDYVVINNKSLSDAQVKSIYELSRQSKLLPFE